MMTQKARLLVFFSVACLSLAPAYGQTGIPTKLTVSNITSSSFTLNFTDLDNVSGYEYELTKMNGKAATITKTFNSNTVTISNLDGNIIYLVRVRGVGNNFIGGTYSKRLSVRTHPAPFSVTTTDPTPNSVTVFLPQLPGVTEWSVKYRIKDTTDETIVRTTNKTYYGVNLNKLSANTQYEIKGRASAVNGISLTQTQSAFGSSLVVTTAMLSVFGNAEFRTSYTPQHSISNSTEYQELLNSLKAAYNNTSIVSNVTITEVENSTTSGNVIVHYELLVTSQSYPSVGSLTLNDSTTVINSFINSGDTPTKKNVLLDESTDSLFQYSGVFLALNTSVDPSCNVIRSYELTLTATSEIGEKIEETKKENTEADIKEPANIFIPNLAFQQSNLSSNTLYNIDQMYFVLYCWNETTNVPIYYRSFETTGENPDPTVFITHKGSFFITTAITEFNTAGYSFESFEDGTGVIICVPAINKAVTYILKNNSEEVGRTEEPNLDSSSCVNIEVNNLTLGNYSFSLEVTVRAHDGMNSTATSNSTIDVNTKRASCMNRCLNGSVCAIDKNSNCNCNTTGSGMDACSTFPCTNPCVENATCAVNNSTFTCQCDAGFVLSLEGCTDITASPTTMETATTPVTTVTDSTSIDTSTASEPTSSNPTTETTTSPTTSITTLESTTSADATTTAESSTPDSTTSVDTSTASEPTSDPTTETTTSPTTLITTLESTMSTDATTTAESTTPDSTTSVDTSTASEPTTNPTTETTTSPTTSITTLESTTSADATTTAESTKPDSTTSVDTSTAAEPTSNPTTNPTTAPTTPPTTTVTTANPTTVSSTNPATTDSTTSQPTSSTATTVTPPTTATTTASTITTKQTRRIPSSPSTEDPTTSASSSPTTEIKQGLETWLIVVIVLILVLLIVDLVMVYLIYGRR